jgi:hypothetical protein
MSNIKPATTTPKHKVIHGEYIEKPTCSVCGSRISHEWLAGDYTMLVCQKEQCVELWGVQHTERKQKKKLETLLTEVFAIFQGNKK